MLQPDSLLLFWEFACHAFVIPEMTLPAPSAIIKSLVQFWPLIHAEALQTLFTTLIGFALAILFGVLLGVLVGASPPVYRAINPLMIAFNSISKVAIVPVLVMWFGIGTVPAV